MSILNKMLRGRAPAVVNIEDVFSAYTYTGNGSDSRNLPATALGFDPEIAHIKGSLGQEAVFKVESLAGDAALQYGTVAAVADRIQSLAGTTGQFQVGTDAETNNNTSAYYWFAAKEYSQFDVIP